MKLEVIKGTAILYHAVSCGEFWILIEDCGS
jgi:hypothetical protein